MYEDSLIPEPATLFDDWSHRSSAHTYAEMSIAKNLWPGDLHLDPIEGLFTPEQRSGLGLVLHAAQRRRSAKRTSKAKRSSSGSTSDT